MGKMLPCPTTEHGLIIDPNGEILTNADVVNGADTVSVTLKDGRTFKGKVMGVDAVRDVAVVRIPANNLLRDFQKINYYYLWGGHLARP